MSRRHAVLAVLLVLAAACGGDDDDAGLGELVTPTFAPDASAGSATTTSGGGPESTDAPPSSVAPSETSPSSAPSIEPGEDAPRQERVRVDDADDDAVGGLADDPPPWTDLAEVTMIRQGNAYGLEVVLAGGSAPERSDGQATMNIASFYDVDGDGRVDYEVWANLGPEGWGGSWFDADGGAAFGEDSNVSIEVDGDEVLILFPDVMVGTPDSFRFSVASEYGGLEVIGSSFARRDDVPDDDRAVAFPG